MPEVKKTLMKSVQSSLLSMLCCRTFLAYGSISINKSIQERKFEGELQSVVPSIVSVKLK